MLVNRRFSGVVLSALVATCLATPAWSAQTLVASDSAIGFVSKQMGVPVQGRFARFDGTVAVDPAKPETGRVVFTVDLDSALVGTAETAAELRKPEWFDVAKTPTATFRSTAIRALGGGRVDVVGNLTIKGVTHEIHVPMTLAQQGDVLKAEGTFTIRRLDYRIGAGEWGDTSLVADEVTVHPRLTVRGNPAP